MRTMLLISLVLASSTACLPPSLLAGRDRCHRAADAGRITAWCRPPGAKTGEVEKCKVEVLAGDRVCPQELFGPELPASPVPAQP